MFNYAKTLQGYQLKSLDGEIGSVKEFYFDDRYWTIRYLVANTGNWLSGRQVLISPYALAEVNVTKKHIVTNLTSQQIEESPSLETDKPVSRQFETDYYAYYGWPGYWNGSFMWGGFPSVERNPKVWEIAPQGEQAWDSNLRSMQEVSGYRVHTKDGEIGHIADFLIDDDSWAIRYLLIDTNNWLPGKKSLISPRWIERVSWDEAKVFFDLTREAVKQAPEHLEDIPPTRDYEIALHRHYKCLGYWEDEPINPEKKFWEHGEPKQALTTF